MGAWSTTILGDDFAADVYGEFIEAYNDGKELSAIRRELETKNKNELNEPDEGPIFWLVLAEAQWDCGSLDSDVLAKVGEIVNKELALDRWREGAPRDLDKRKKFFLNFMPKFRRQIQNQKNENHPNLFRRFLKPVIVSLFLCRLEIMERLWCWVLTTVTKYTARI
jgi:hypothetical protein